MHQPALKVCLRGFLLTAATVAIAAGIALGLGWLLVYEMNACEAVASSFEDMNDCDPGLGAFLGVTAYGLSWLLPGALGLAFAFAALLKWLLTGQQTTK
jgi:hypothetical protein